MKTFLVWLLLIGTTITGIAGCTTQDQKPKEENTSRTETRQGEESKPSKPEDKPRQEEKKQENGEITEEEFLAYMDMIRPILAEQLSMAQLYDEIRQANANQQITDEELAALIFKNVLPMTKQIEESFEAVLPPKSLREIHEKFIKIARLNRQGMEEIVKAVDTGDFSLINQANAYFAEARALDRELAYFLEDMVKKFGIKSNGSSDTL